MSSRVSGPRISGLGTRLADLIDHRRSVVALIAEQHEALGEGADPGGLRPRVDLGVDGGVEDQEHDRHGPRRPALRPCTRRCSAARTSRPAAGGIGVAAGCRGQRGEGRVDLRLIAGRARNRLPVRLERVLGGRIGRRVGRNHQDPILRRDARRESSASLVGRYCVVIQ